MKRPNAVNNHIFAEKVANIAKLNNIQCISANIYNDSALQKIDDNGGVITSSETTFEMISLPFFITAAAVSSQEDSIASIFIFTPQKYFN